jgi:hypothetical protein
VNVYPNHRVAEVKSAAWVALFRWYLPLKYLLTTSLGEEHMINLLLNTSVFIGLKNDFFVQLTGSPFLNETNLGTSLADTTPLPQTSYPIARPMASNPTNTTTLKRKRNSTVHRAEKKRKCTHPDDKNNFPKTPNAIIFARSRMFYARPARSLRGNVMFGLRKERHSHINTH